MLWYAYNVLFYRYACSKIICLRREGFVVSAHQGRENDAYIRSRFLRDPTEF